MVTNEELPGPDMSPSMKSFGELLSVLCTYSESETTTNTARGTTSENAVLGKNTDRAHQIVIDELAILKFHSHNECDQAIVADKMNGDVIIDFEGDKKDVESSIDKKKQQSHSEQNEETAMESRPEQDESMEENDGQNCATYDLEQTDVEIVAKTKSIKV